MKVLSVHYNIDDQGLVGFFVLSMHYNIDDQGLVGFFVCYPCITILTTRVF